MTQSEELLETLVARCLEAEVPGYRDELERLCTEHVALAAELRARIEQLERLGFLGDAGGSAATARWLPDRVGNYQVLGVLGRGGMGVVFRGRAPDGREVAIKIVRPDLLADERAQARFRREGELASRLADPGICSPLEVGVDDGVPYLVMPLLVGSTFGAWWREHRADTTRMLELVEQFARALHVAHEAGLVHRDVTPGNLFVTGDGRAVVLDFGLARDTSAQQATLTMSQEQIGTLPYMAPEQLRGARVDRRSDVYSLGVVLYEALSGRLPYAARQRSELSRLITSGAAPRLRGIVRGVPRGLARVVAHAMDVEAGHRYGTALDLAEDLRRCRAGEPVSARLPGPWLRLRRWARNHPIAAVTMVALSTLLGVASGLLGMLREQVRVQRATAATLTSRALEGADPMRAIDAGLQAHAADPTPATLGQLNRLLHQVSMLATAELHASPVRRLAVIAADQDHDRVAVASEGALSLFLLHRRSGALREERRLAVDPGVQLGCVRFSPNGRYVAYGGTQKSVYVTPVSEPDPRRLSGAIAEVLGVVVEDDGTVAAAVASGQVLQWDVGKPDDAPRKVLGLPRLPLGPGLEVMVRGLVVGPGGDFLVWNWTCALRLARDGTRVWHTAVPDVDAGMMVVAFDSAGERILLGQAGTLRMVRWADGQEVWKPPMSSRVVDAAMTERGTVASVHADGVVRIWAGGDEPIAQYHDPDDQCSAILAAPGAESFLVAGRAGAQRRLDSLGRVERSLVGGDIERWGVSGPFAWSTDGTVLLAGGGPGRVRAWDFDGSRSEGQTRFVESPPIAVALHPDGRQLLVVTFDRRVWLWDPDGARPTSLGLLPMTFRARGSHQPGDPVVFGGLADRVPTAAVFDAARGAFRTVAVPSKDPHAAVGVAWLPGQRLAVAGGDVRWAPPRIALVDAAESAAGAGASLGAVEVAPDRGMLTCLDASRDGRWIVAGFAAGGLDVWSGEPGGPYRLRRTLATNGRVWTVDLTAAGDQVVAGIQDGSVLLWRCETAEPEVLVAPRGRPARAMFGAGDRLVVEFVPDGLLHVWDLAVSPPERVLEVVVGEGAVVLDAVAFSAPGAAPGDRRGMRVVTVTSDGWVRRWSLDAEALAGRARQRLAALRAR